MEDEDSVVHKKETADKKGIDCKKNEVRGERNTRIINICIYYRKDLKIMCQVIKY